MLGFNLITKEQSHDKILKSLAFSICGKGKETLLATFDAICRPVINNAEPLRRPELVRRAIETALEIR